MPGNPITNEIRTSEKSGVKLTALETDDRESQ